MCANACQQTHGRGHAHGTNHGELPSLCRIIDISPVCHTVCPEMSSLLHFGSYLTSSSPSVCVTSP
jgi:hypothetical protein